MSSPWLKKRDNYGGNIGKNKKSSENFMRKHCKKYVEVTLVIENLDF